MSVFRIANIGGTYDEQAQVYVVGEDKKSEFLVVVGQDSGCLQSRLYLTPDQSRRLRQALEDAEAKAEILTAAI